MAVKRIMTILLSLTALVLAGCTAHGGTGVNTAPPSTQKRAVKKQVATTWRIGHFTIYTHLLPKVYDPHGSWNWMSLTPSALYYVPKSTPTEVVVESLPNGHTHAIANVDCGKQFPAIVGLVQSSYLLVDCFPPNSELLHGTLVDIKTGTTWTLWTHGYGASDGTFFFGAWVYKGWVYYEVYTTGNGEGLTQQALNLATGATKSSPYPFGQYITAYRTPDGTLYGIKWSSSAPDYSVDLYRLNGPFESTLVAKNLPAFMGQGILSMLTIDANGTIWVPRQGGTLTPSAGAMTIRVAKPTPAPPKSKVLTNGIGYVVSLGTPPSAYAESPVQVTVATPHGAKTITVGNTPDVQDDYGVMPYGDSEVVFFPARNGRWQIVTVSRGSSP